jgi:hypothetical protein
VWTKIGQCLEDSSSDYPFLYPRLASIGGQSKKLKISTFGWGMVGCWGSIFEIWRVGEEIWVRFFLSRRMHGLRV